MQAFMIYLIITWIAFNVGFVLGAAWCGLGKKNEAYGKLFGKSKTRQWVQPTLD